MCAGMLLHFCAEIDKGNISFTVIYHNFIGAQVEVERVYLAPCCPRMNILAST